MYDTYHTMFLRKLYIFFKRLLRHRVSHSLQRCFRVILAKFGHDDLVNMKILSMIFFWQNSNKEDRIFVAHFVSGNMSKFHVGGVIHISSHSFMDSMRSPGRDIHASNLCLVLPTQFLNTEPWLGL